jgi:hypothetical protein
MAELEDTTAKILVVLNLLCCLRHGLRHFEII